MTSIRLVGKGTGFFRMHSRGATAHWVWPGGVLLRARTLARVTTAILATISLFLISPDAMGGILGRVVDLHTNNPVHGAIVTAHGEIVETDENGIFRMTGGGNSVTVKAHGYWRAEQMLAQSREIKLAPFVPKAVYLSFYGIGHEGIRGSALQLIRETELNALVIDVKGDRGMITYRSAIPLASAIGAQDLIIVKDMRGLMAFLKENRIYTIARIVVFKDDLLALKRPDLAVRTEGGVIWKDREKLAWTDPFKREVWNYNIDIAIEAAQYGFDEIQFDYVRFPDASGLRFSMPNTEKNRVGAISGFLETAKKRLASHNVFLAADVFGYVGWNLNDTQIGQKLEDLAPHLDYISPMLYPSGFQFGIPGYKNPVKNAYEVVYQTLKRAQERLDVPSIRFRPWLQAFKDYAFDRRTFDGKEIRTQIDAAEQFGSNGWMLWNPRNTYDDTGLRKVYGGRRGPSPTAETVARIRPEREGREKYTFSLAERPF